jgi:prephenate dehydrogenase
LLTTEYEIRNTRYGNNMLNGKKVVIVGLGLMGGSLGYALKKRFPKCRVIGLSRKQANIRKAIQKKIINEGTTKLEKAIGDADWIIICTPVDKIIPFLKKIDAAAKKGALVTDVGSTKKEIVDWTDCYSFKNIHFVGSHPLAGNHERGLESACPSLYEKGFCFVARGRKTNKTALKRTIQFWKALKQRVEIINSKQHDEIVAGISHLPHIVASLLTSSVDSKKLPYAGCGFKDTTRIAEGDAGLWNAIIQQNRVCIQKELKNFRKHLDSFLICLQKKQGKQILSVLAKAGQKRKSLD